MTVNNNLFVSAAILQDYFVDKDSGSPLSGGVVSLFVDTDRTTPKNWYYQTGSPGAYTYVALPNPLTLSSVGTIQVNGQDVIPFFYPYVEDGSETVQLYYVTVFNSANVEQFTRAGFPGPIENNSAPDAQQVLENLIPNGQFAAHTDISTTGQLTNTSTQAYTIAAGGYQGWQYIRSGATITDTDFVTFDYLAEEAAGVTGNPRWAARIICTNATGSCSSKTLEIHFSNVNHFEFDPSVTYTFSFASRTNTTSAITATLNVIQNFGTGGSSTQTLPITTFNIPASGVGQGTFAQQSISFSFPSASSGTVGTNNDDFVGLQLVFPVASGSVFNISLTNMFLAVGDFTLTSYPDRPDNSVFAAGVAGSGYLPNPDGSDLYLPMICTPAGFGFDTSSIGKPYASDAPTLAANELLLNGTTYVNGTYSTTGIPYQRLGNYYLNNGYKNSITVSASTYSYQIPQYGTGFGFVTSTIAPNTTVANSWIYISSNSAGTSTVVTDGASASGLTIPASGTIQQASQSSSLGVLATAQTTSGVLSGITIRSLTRNANYTGSGTVPNTGVFTLNSLGSSGITLTVIENSLGLNYQPSGSPPASAADPSFASSGTPLVGKLTGFGSTLSNYANGYIQWTNPNGGSSFFIWYSVNGSPSSAPGGSGTAVRVNLVTGDQTTDIIYKTLVAFQGGFLSTIASTASPNNGGYFTFSAGGNNYAVWFNINGTGTAPSISNTTLIEVPLPSGSLNAPQVACAISQAINSYSYAVADFRGMILRGVDGSNAVWDADLLTRTSFGNNLLGGAIPGTLEYDLVGAHQHSQRTAGMGSTYLSSGTAGTNGTLTIASVEYGGGETRPVNVSVNWVTKY